MWQDQASHFSNHIQYPIPSQSNKFLHYYQTKLNLKQEESKY